MSMSSDSLLEYRQQPLLELVQSEENYVQQLQLVRDTYMRVVNTQNFLVPTPSLLKCESCCAERPSTLLPDPLPSLEQPIPSPPGELANRWRVIWGNWLQLTEWHSKFVEKLKHAVHEQPPDAVPRLFLSSQARLRSMYMKYCENYSKAVVLVAPFKTYFEELRRVFLDKNDILSRLMQPIQRVTRYQLPMMEALKLTEQAGAAETATWRAAVAVLRNLPNDVQLMLEAARIVGFPGSLTSQGNLRLFGAMFVARTTQAELRSAQTVAKQVKTKTCGTHHSSFVSKGSAAAAVVFRGRAMTSPVFMRVNNSGINGGMAGGTDQRTSAECDHCRIRSKCCTAAQKSINLHFTECRVFLFDQCLIIAEDNTPSPSAISPSESSSVCNSFQANLGRVFYGSGSLFQRSGRSTLELRPQRSLRLCTEDEVHTPVCAGRSPAVRRTARIRRHGSHLGSLESDVSGTLGCGGSGNWPKLGWSTPQDPFRQSNYKFIHAVKVNRMAFAPDWLSPNMKHLDSPDMDSKNTHDNSTTDKPSSSEMTSASTGHPFSEHSAQEVDMCSVSGNSGNCQVPDRLWFAVADKAPSSDAIFILDPFTEKAREAWLREIVDIAEMQAQLQMALQNPRRFHLTNNMRRQTKTLSSTDMTTLCTHWHCERRTAFFSSHSSTTELVDACVDARINTSVLTDQKDRGLHIRGVSAPQADWWKQVSDNNSPDCCTECNPSIESPRRLQISSNASQDSSVPDIIQTPDNVFLPNAAQEGDSNHLQLPVQAPRSHLRRRSLSHSDADSVDARQIVSSEHSPLSPERVVVHVHSNASLCRALSFEQSVSATSVTPQTQNPLPPVPTNTIASDTQKKKIMTYISTRLRCASQGLAEALSKQNYQSAPNNESTTNPAKAHRGRFRWSIVDKGTISENAKRSLPPQSPSRPPPPLIPSSSFQLPAKSQTPLTGSAPTECRSMRSQSPIRKPPNKSPSVEVSDIKRPPPSIRMLKRLRLSFRANSRNDSTVNTDINKSKISSLPPITTHIRTSISTDGI